MKKIIKIILPVVFIMLFTNCNKDKGDEDTGITDTEEIENLMNESFTILAQDVFVINPDSYQIDNNIIVNSPNDIAPLVSGQTMTNSISFTNNSNNPITAVGMRFGTNGPVYCVPVDNNTGVGIFDFIINSGICDDLSQICHDIRCYEFAITDAGTISADSIRQVAMICGNCDEPSCQGLVDPSDCDGDGGNNGAIVGSWRLTQEIDHEDGFPDDIYNVPNGCDFIITFFNNSITRTGDNDCDGIIDETSNESYNIVGDIININNVPSARIITLNNTTLRLRIEEDNNSSYYIDNIYERQ